MHAENDAVLEEIRKKINLYMKAFPLYPEW